MGKPATLFEDFQRDQQARRIEVVFVVIAIFAGCVGGLVLPDLLGVRGATLRDTGLMGFFLLPFFAVFAVGRVIGAIVRRI